MSDEQRVIVYIDGFNLYYGMKQARLKRLLWLNLRKLSLNILTPGQVLSKVKYFTARVSDTAWDTNKSQRQNVELYFGKYLSKTVKCKKCGNEWQKFEEKQFGRPQEGCQRPLQNRRRQAARISVRGFRDEGRWVCAKTASQLEVSIARQP